MSDGFKMSAWRSGTIGALRPNKLRIGDEGEESNQEIVFDGYVLMAHREPIGEFAEIPAYGDLVDGLESATEALGAVPPSA